MLYTFLCVFSKVGNRIKHEILNTRVSEKRFTNVMKGESTIILFFKYLPHFDTFKLAEQIVK